MMLTANNHRNMLECIRLAGYEIDAAGRYHAQGLFQSCNNAMATSDRYLANAIAFASVR